MIQAKITLNFTFPSYDKIKNIFKCVSDDIFMWWWEGGKKNGKCHLKKLSIARNILKPSIFCKLKNFLLILSLSFLPPFVNSLTLSPSKSGFPFLFRPSVCCSVASKRGFVPPSFLSSQEQCILTSLML